MVVPFSESDQLIVGTLLNDPSLLENDDQVAVTDRGQPVGNDKGSPSLHQLIHSRLDDLFCPRIDGAGRFVEDERRRIRDSRAGDRQELALALGEVCPVSCQHGVIAIRQTPDKAVGIGELCRADDLLLRGIQLTVADVIAHGAGKEVGILQDNAQRTAQISLSDLVDIDIIIADLSVLNIIEPVDQICDRSLTCTGRADKGDLHAGFCMDPDVVKDDFVIPVPEIDAVKGNISLQRLISGAVCRLVIMLPGPLPCVFLHFDDLPVFVAEERPA